MKLKEAVRMELKELRRIQKGLPPSSYRKTIDKKIHELFCKLVQLEKEEPSVLSKFLITSKKSKVIIPPQKKKRRPWLICKICGAKMKGSVRRNRHMKRNHPEL